MAPPGERPFAPAFERVRWAPGLESGLSRRRRRPADYQATLPALIAEARVDVSSAVVAACGAARAAIAAFDAASQEPDLGLVAMALLRSEAVASSRIERLRVSNRGLALALHDPARSKAAAREAAGNVAAMRQALLVGASVGITVDGILAIHRQLLQSTDANDIAGVLRTEAVWIGGATPLEADFVPPPASHVARLLDDLELFAARRDLDPIIKAAIVHAQFEAIHPFADGNGRVGRCLIHTQLRRDRVTERVTIPVSTLLLHDRDGYFAALTAYQQQGEVDPWIAHFADAAEQAVSMSRTLSTDIAALRDQWIEATGRPRAGSVHRRLIEALPSQPVVDLSTVARSLDVDDRTALRGLKRLADAGVLRDVTGRGRDRVFVAEEVFDLLDQTQASIGHGPDAKIGPSRHLRKET